jgi:hypothetical protein
MKTLRSLTVSALAAAALLGITGCGAMSAGGQHAVGGAEAEGFIGYQLVKSK